jgi:hypothetical protein
MLNIHSNTEGDPVIFDLGGNPVRFDLGGNPVRFYQKDWFE